MLCFTFRWDEVTAVTVIPFLLWAGAGTALAGCDWIVFRSRPAAYLILLWGISALLCADESTGLLRSCKAKPTIVETSPTTNLSAPSPTGTLRVITLNCGSGHNPLAAAEIEPYKPDIIFLQESPHYRFVHEFAKKLYGEQNRPLYGYDCTIIARGNLRRTSKKHPRNQLQATLELPDGRQIELLNLHLSHAVTDLKLWRRSTWKSHYYNRIARRRQLTKNVSDLLVAAGHRPTIIAGDFNAPGPDAIFTHLQEHFTDTYQQAGSGWCNTFSSHFPLIRIDQIWTSAEFTALRHTAVQCENSDHRIVVSDIEFNPLPRNP